jgi:asparagine synthase (glutamine-hydrolysing)
MCGIAGFWGSGDHALAQKMAAALHHRGPDHQGTWQHHDLHLSFARLSILDLDARSHQPFRSPDEKYALVFNGEIYNFLDLKAQLQAQGYTFRTTSDTEVLLYACIAWGRAALPRLRGMFAFAFYDAEKKELLLARDRMGKKPLYYISRPGLFAFASEPKALWLHPAVPKTLSLPALAAYLILDYVPTPYALTEGLHKLEGGHYLVVRDKAIVEGPTAYWQPPFDKPLTIPFEEARERLDNLLSEATKIRLVADVPVGVFLSGGIDSSTIAYYAQKHSSTPIQTFSIAFTEKSYDESSYARKVATFLGTDHYEETLTPQRTRELLDEVFAQLDEPFADASILPTYFLSQITRKKVTVALGGDGGDELLAGYPTFIADLYQGLLAWAPRPLVHLLMRTAEKLLPPSDANIAFDFKVRQFLKGFTGSAVERHTRWLASFLPADLPHLLQKDLWHAIAPLFQQESLFFLSPFLKALPPHTPLFSKVLLIYYKTYLQEDILFKVDRASMYHSLEVRAPFLDREVVEFLTRLPRSYKQRGHETKYILKKLMKGRLPEEVLQRPKKGFGIPLPQWIRHDLRQEMEALLFSPDRIFNASYVKALWENHLSRRQNNRKLLWNLYTFKRVLATWGIGL